MPWHSSIKIVVFSVAESKIEGSLNISIDDEAFMEKLKVLDTTKAVYIYCEMGGRSARAAKLVEDMGFPQIYDLDGGITAWEEGDSEEEE